MARAIVRLKPSGTVRVLDSHPGQMFEVKEFTPGAQGPVAQVVDPRFTNGIAPQVWSLGWDQYEVVRGEDQGSGCECCDHALEHVIRDAINKYENATPIISVRSIMEELGERLEQWKEDRESITVRSRGTQRA